MGPLIGKAAKPTEATPPAKKVLRPGLAGKHDGFPHRQLRKNLRPVELALIPSSHSLLSGFACTGGRGGP
jgi:hypothetical protein